MIIQMLTCVSISDGMVHSMTAFSLGSLSQPTLLHGVHAGTELVCMSFIMVGISGIVRIGNMTLHVLFCMEFHIVYLFCFVLLTSI